jgi:hypothetical protein
MSTEYVRITPPEQVYGETNLLQTQLSLLTTLKHYQEYELLRKEELLMKIEAKKCISEAKEFLDSVSKCLPESKLLEEQEKEEKIRKQIIDKIETSVERARKTEWKYWKEREPKVREVKEIKPQQVKPKEEKHKVKEVKEEKLSPLDKELAEINKKLAKLQ